ncbi:hypothetical protein GCM10009733_021310 [Nonomuraea maheshkhaliensis]|uniref:Uncharacterized protein n=1 Tax=Nonomuraea maheshkhaliensis TaxID=419590 RepID=A0ABP4R1B5_9ACTN
MTVSGYFSSGPHEGKTADQAFDDAARSWGMLMGGEPLQGKIDYVLVKGGARPYADANALARQLAATDPLFSDPDGPAGVILLDDGTWLIFGRSRG